MNKTKQAFTLVELIVVITILAILGTIAFISLQGYNKASRNSVRISDVSKMKTSLELYHLNSNKYPLPDDNYIVDYDGDTLWYQGIFGETTISKLSRNISKIPLDPLTGKGYIFSTANNKNEFEILILLEGDLGFNSIKQINAATISVTPRIDGTYNGIMIKTPNYIVPTPSIINSEDIGEGVGLTLDEFNIQSQIVNGGENIPNIGNLNYNTGSLDGLILSVYTGSITNDSTTQERVELVVVIQKAYSGSSLSTEYIYQQILQADSEYEKLQLVEGLIFGDFSNYGITDPTIDIVTSENPVDITLSGVNGEEFTCDLCD